MKLIVYLLGYILWIISFLFPRNPKIWVFGGSHGAFSDNAKYLFIYTSLHNKDIKPIWISYHLKTVHAIREMGFKSYFLFSISGLYYALRGGYYFFNSYSSDICFFTSGKTICVNLWHGVGLKKIEFCIDRGPLYDRYVRKTLKERFFYPQVYKRPDYFISSTPFQTVKFAAAFQINESQCLNFGYPRNDQFFLPEDDRKIIETMYNSEAGVNVLNQLRRYEKVYLYMPTWRESQRNLFAEHMDLNVLNAIMSENKSLLVLKPHANTIVDNADRMSAYSNLLLLRGDMDIYPLLPYTHVLITDYSSILYDYLLLEDKGVILYLYDYREYVHERDFNYPFLDNVAGEVAYSFNELIDIIQKDTYHKDRYTAIKEKFWGNYDGTACRKISQYFSNKN